MEEWSGSLLLLEFMSFLGRCQEMVKFYKKKNDRCNVDERCKKL